jgi:hypothetical protein
VGRDRGWRSRPRSGKHGAWIMEVLGVIGEGGWTRFLWIVDVKEGIK